MAQIRGIARKISTGAQRLYRCDRGAEGLEKLLIIGAIVLPLLAVLFFYRKEITDMVRGNWDTVESDSSDLPTDDGTFDTGG